MPLFTDKSSLTSGKQVQQTYRFVLRIKGVDSALIQDVTAPSYTIGTDTVNMLEYKFKYPTKLEWNGEVTFNIIQILDTDLITSTLGFFMQKIYNSSYYVSPMGVSGNNKNLILPKSFYNAKSKISDFLSLGTNSGYKKTPEEGTVLDVSKQKLTSALRTVEIISLDEEGKTYESWRLNNAFITSVQPDNFSYTNEGIAKISVKLSYDWADYGFRGVYSEEDVVSRILSL